MPDKFKCKEETNGECNRLKQKCVGWMRCPINGHGAPCPQCVGTSKPENKQCGGCVFHD